MNKNPRLSFLAIAFFASFLFLGKAQASVDTNTISSSLLSVPFISNSGQYPETVRYVADLMPGTVSVYNTSLSYTFPSSTGFIETPVKGAFTPSASDQASTTVNYFIGNDANQWKTNIATYNTVSLGEVFDGVSVDLKAKPNTVEKVFTVAPQASPKNIVFTVSKNVVLSVSKDGNLVVSSINKKDLVSFGFSKPIAYQVVDNKQVNIPVAYRLKNNRTYGFSVGKYDTSLPLVIDPELDTVVASTLLGGNNSDSGPRGMIGSDGTIYFAAVTVSTNLPTTTGAYGPNLIGTASTFVAKMSDTAHLTALTYIGSPGVSSIPAQIALDSAGRPVIYGVTSGSFPTTPGAFQTTSLGSNDTFLTIFSSDLTSLVASTLYGSTGNETPSNFKIDASGNFYIYGRTGSALDLPMAGSPYDPVYSAGGATATFIAKMNSNLTSLLATTYLQGNSTTFGNDLLIDNAGNVWVTGQTAATNFPTSSGAYQGSKDTSASYDAYITEFNSSLSTMLHSTYLGGSGDDIGDSLALDEEGNVYVYGTTASNNFPNTTSTDGYQKVHAGGGTDFFIAKLDTNLTTLSASTYLGGVTASGEFLSVSTRGSNIGLVRYASSTEVIVFGETPSTSTFPTTVGAYQRSGNGGSNATIVSKLSGDLKNLVGSTMFNAGGSVNSGSFVPLQDGTVYVFGYLSIAGPTFPVRNAYQSALGSSFDTAVTRFASTPSIASITPSSVNAGSSSFSIVINGSAFAPSSTVQFNGSQLALVVVNSSSMITATVPADAVSLYGAYSVTVANGGLATSSAATFTVNNPVPSLSALSVSRAVQMSNSASLTLTGTNFVPSSQVVFDGNTISTSYINATTLSATIPANLLTQFGDFNMYVSNPAPGGGDTNAMVFTITPLGQAAIPIAPPTPPLDGKGFSIVTAPQSTNSVITVTNKYGPDTTRVAYAVNDPAFTYSSQDLVTPSAQLDLCAHGQQCAVGAYTLYARFYNSYGIASSVVTTSVFFSGVTNKPLIPVSACSMPQLKRTLKTGSTGSDVKNLQIYFNCSGYTVAKSGFGSAGKETSFFGPATKAALIKWQKAHVAPLKKAYRPGELDRLTLQVINGVL